MNYNGKKIVIIGLGITGLSCIDFFLSYKTDIYVIEIKSTLKNKNILKNIKYHFGSIKRKWIMNADLIVINPGISLKIPGLKEAIKKGIKIVSDIEIFSYEVNKPIISITGSNGKSTVATLVYYILKKNGWNVAIGGNIGIPVLSLLKKKYDLYILELSSFQLETTFSLKSNISTILNITEDHLDRYPKGFSEYCSKKLKIYDNALTCIINEQDKNTWPLLKEKKDCISFGINSGNYQLNTTKKTLESNGKKLIDINQIHLTGEHNYLNILAAIAITKKIGIPYKNILNNIIKYTPLPYRMECIHKYKGIKWINDSKSTNLGSTIAALKATKTKKNIHLIMGGILKSKNIEILYNYIKYSNIKLYCFGKDGHLLLKLKKNSILKNTIQELIQHISPLLKKGDIVLFSPGCSSFDQFNNFEHRGKTFTKLVKKND
ncbi:MAG: UDP-N-acetylmuramoyl-L-alanine--D-glutamate ligase [Arsenophonus sp.]|nr:MAG: UDP-N-acetylmuramoyl-L-alanine--D-glutamate ligase [Arsenophonus sp.]